jgi:hypothetical protein
MVYTLKIAGKVADFVFIHHDELKKSELLKITEAKCLIFSDGTVSITAILNNLNEKPKFISPNQFQIIISNGSLTMRRIEALLVPVSTTSTNLITVIQPASKGIILGMVGKVNPASLEWPLNQTTECMFAPIKTREFSDEANADAGDHSAGAVQENKDEPDMSRAEYPEMKYIPGQVGP